MRLNAESLSQKILSADPAILRVFIIDEKGKELTHVYSKELPKKARLGKKAEEMVAGRDVLALGMFQQEESFYGSMDFILIAYKGTKVMLMYSKKHRVYLAARILRSGNVEYLHTKIEQVLKQS